MKIKNIPLHWLIIIALVAGIAAGLIFSALGLTGFVNDWIKPFGDIFISLLKLIAVPLVLVSLIKGISNLTDISKLSRMGGKTVLFYLGSTVIAICIGLTLANILKPGMGFSKEQKEKFSQQYEQKLEKQQKEADKVQERGPLKPLVDMFPSNAFNAFSDNSKMLQVIVFAILFGVAMVSLKQETVAPVRSFFEAVYEIVLKIVSYIITTAPVGVFALLTAQIVEFAGDKPGKAIALLEVLGFYAAVVLAGLLLMAYVIYPLILKIFTGYTYSRFINGIAPAQMMAFSTSSSAATLPVTMNCAENNLGVSKETSSFVLPLGATINMDGTSLYQAVAAIFIAQVYAIELSLAQQIGIITTATLASVGAAAVPGAGIIMLVIVLEQAGIPVEGIALILAPDRLLDMCRTTVNITGDSAISLLIDKSEKQAASKAT